MSTPTKEAARAASVFQRIVKSVGKEQQDQRSERLRRALKKAVPEMGPEIEDVYAHPSPVKPAELLRGVLPKTLRDKCAEGRLCLFSVGGVTWLASIHGACAPFALALEDGVNCLHIWRLDMNNEDMLCRNQM